MSEQAVGCGEPGGVCPAAEAIGNFLESSPLIKKRIFVTQVTQVGKTMMTAGGNRFGPKEGALEPWFNSTKTPNDCPYRKLVNDKLDPSGVQWHEGHRSRNPEPDSVRDVIFGVLETLEELRDAAANCSNEQRVTIAGSDQ